MTFSRFRARSEESLLVPIFSSCSGSKQRFSAAQTAEFDPDQWACHRNLTTFLGLFHVSVIMVLML
jgi:hypothetical protein